MANTSNQRPEYMSGTSSIGGIPFRWGSGMPGRYWSIPYGDYPVTPNAPTGQWAHQVGAIPIANNVIPDPQLGRNRIGIMIHSGSEPALNQLYTQGCFKVDPQDWPKVRAEILAEADKGPLYLHVAPGGVASFSNSMTPSAPTNNTPAGNANTVANTSAVSPPAFNPNAYPANRANTTSAQRDAFNRAYAQSIGYNPDIVSGISRAEGLNAGGAGPSRVDVQGGQPYSWGDFQLNVRNGLGTTALAQGINPADPNQWQKANMFAINQMAKSGVGPWKGDPYARNLLASGKAPAPMGQGGIGSDAVASGTAGTPATPTVGSAIASLTQPTAGGGPSSLQSAAKSMGIGGDSQDGGGDQTPKPSDSGLAQSMQQSAMAGQARQQQIQQQAAQLAAQWRQAGMQPLTWGSRPYGSTAGPQQQIPGTTLNSIGG